MFQLRRFLLGRLAIAANRAGCGMRMAGANLCVPQAQHWNPWQECTPVQLCIMGAVFAGRATTRRPHSYSMDKLRRAREGPPGFGGDFASKTQGAGKMKKGDPLGSLKGLAGSFLNTQI